MIVVLKRGISATSQCLPNLLGSQDVRHRINKGIMKENLRISIRAFFYFTIVVSICLGTAFSIYSSKIIKGFAFGSLAGILSGIIMTIYLFIGLTLFQKKLFFYSNIPEQLQAHAVRNIYFESIAGNATSGRIKYGGLFLTDDSILFIPHRFAIKPFFITLPLKEVKEVKKTGINLLKFFSGGLRNRLFIQTVDGEHYEFSVWDIDVWIEKIDKRLKNKMAK